MANEDTLRRLVDGISGSTDAFGKLIADGTRNYLDLPSVYPFNPERYRLLVDGVKTDPTTTSSFTDGQRDFQITPAAGETVQLKTAERPRYVVGYDAAGSWAFEGLTDVSANDTVRIGLTDNDATGNGENAAYFEFTASGQRAVLVKSGTEVDSETWEYPPGYGFQSFQRPEIKYNAYDAGRWLFSIGYTDGTRNLTERQIIENVAELTVDQEGATDEYNFNLFFEVDSPDGTTELSAGSMAFITYGDTTPTYRVKGQRLTGLQTGTTGNYVPVAAFRKDPNNANIFVEFSQMSCFFANGSGQALLIAVDPGDTDASGFSTPPEHSETNSVVEYTTSVTTFPDSTGSVVSSAANPGGYQIAETSYETGGPGAPSRTGSSSVRRKRPLHNGDYAILLLKADTTTDRTVSVSIDTEQDW